MVNAKLEECISNYEGQRIGDPSLNMGVHESLLRRNPRILKYK